MEVAPPHKLLTPLPLLPLLTLVVVKLFTLFIVFNKYTSYTVSTIYIDYTVASMPIYISIWFGALWIWQYGLYEQKVEWSGWADEYPLDCYGC